MAPTGSLWSASNDTVPLELGVSLWRTSRPDTRAGLMLGCLQVVLIYLQVLKSHPS